MSSNPDTYNSFLLSPLKCRPPMPPTGHPLGQPPATQWVFSLLVARRECETPWPCMAPPLCRPRAVWPRESPVTSSSVRLLNCEAEGVTSHPAGGR